MSFLKGLKQKLSSVGDDISKSLRSGKRDASGPRQVTIDDCSFLGGAQLLEKYQNDWSGIHEGNESAARIANRADATIGLLHAFVARQHAQYLRTAAVVREDLPRLELDLDAICASLAAVSTATARAELALAQLEDLIEWGELRRNEAAAQATWMGARRRSANQLETARVARAQEHAQRVAASERRRQDSQRERAATFEEEFQRDVRFFREHGRLDRAGSHASGAEEEQLAHIEVSDERDRAALDDFLDAPEPPHRPDGQPDAAAEEAEVEEEDEDETVFDEKTEETETAEASPTTGVES